MQVVKGPGAEAVDTVQQPPVEAPQGADPGEEDEEIEETAAEHPPCDEDVTSIMFIVPNDHDRIKGLYRRYKDPTDTPHQRQLLAWQLLRELTVHILAEETVLYPVVGEQIEEHMRDHALDEHESLKLFSSDLENMKLEDEGYDDKMHQLMETFLEHIHEEEHKMMPALREIMDEPQLREMGKRFQEAKQHLPTRDAARFNGTPPALGSPSTEVLREGTVGGPA